MLIADFVLARTLHIDTMQTKSYMHNDNVATNSIIVPLTLDSYVWNNCI